MHSRYQPLAEQSVRVFAWLNTPLIFCLLTMGVFLCNPSVRAGFVPLTRVKSAAVKIFLSYGVPAWENEQQFCLQDTHVLWYWFHWWFPCSVGQWSQRPTGTFLVCASNPTISVYAPGLLYLKLGNDCPGSCRSRTWSCSGMGRALSSQHCSWGAQLLFGVVT